MIGRAKSSLRDWLTAIFESRDEFEPQNLGPVLYNHHDVSTVDQYLLFEIQILPHSEAQRMLAFEICNYSLESRLDLS